MIIMSTTSADIHILLQTNRTLLLKVDMIWTHLINFVIIQVNVLLDDTINHGLIGGCPLSPWIMSAHLNSAENTEKHEESEGNSEYTWQNNQNCGCCANGFILIWVLTLAYYVWIFRGLLWSFSLNGFFRLSILLLWIDDGFLFSLEEAWSGLD